jgi:hypothetical protein
MPGRHHTIQVEPGSELDRVLESVPDTEVVLVKAGVHYRLSRVDPRGGERAESASWASERVLDIIGLGASAEGSHIARHKDAYLADAADHRDE